MDYIIGIAFFAFIFWIIGFARKANKNHIKKNPPAKRESANQKLRREAAEAGKKRKTVVVDNPMPPDEFSPPEEIHFHEMHYFVKRPNGNIEPRKKLLPAYETARSLWFKEKLQSYKDGDKTWRDYLNQHTDIFGEHYWTFQINHIRGFKRIKKHLHFDTEVEKDRFIDWVENDGQFFNKFIDN